MLEARARLARAECQFISVAAEAGVERDRAGRVDTSFWDRTLVS